MARVTINSINKALSATGLDCEIVKGYGYFYFCGPAMDQVREEHGVYGVFRLSDLTIEQWVSIASEKISSNSSEAK
jgi:hypothetical protein